MMSALRVLAAGLLIPALLALSRPARGDENADLELIPGAVREAQAGEAAAPAPPANTNHRGFLEESATAYGYRTDLLVPLPPQSRADWQERLSLDRRDDWTLRPHLHAVYSGRLNVIGQDNLTWPSDQNFRHDLREGYFSWEPFTRTYLDAGRINLKSGVAAGFNPTDFFKTRAVVDVVSQDPSVLRENRLGTAMVRLQEVWSGGSVTLAFAPQFYQPTAVYNTDDLPSVDPMFDRTNAAQRVLLKGSVDLPGDVSPELLVYQENTRTTYGANLTYTLGRSVVTYLEWAGGNRGSLITEAIAYGKQTRTLPEQAPQLLPGDTATSFQQDVAVGASYATESKITFNLEYDYHQAGFTQQDWDNWFSTGQAFRQSVPVTGELWYIRAYAQEQLEPISRESYLLRADWTDALVRDLELVGLAIVNAYDGSSLVQFTASYYLSSRWTIGALAVAEAGSPHSERGSLPQESSLVLKAIRYF
ncbi:MAG TPA: hypothetical protein VL359_21000 [bacterium]|nr:hypothetical protein [bacterium]